MERRPPTIYAPMWRLWLADLSQVPYGQRPTAFDQLVEVLALGVPDFIQHQGAGWDEWLPEPIPFSHDEDTDAWRAVVIVRGGSAQGTARNEHEFVDTLVVAEGRIYAGASWELVLDQINAALLHGATIFWGWEP